MGQKTQIHTGSFPGSFPKVHTKGATRQSTATNTTTSQNHGLQACACHYCMWGEGWHTWLGHRWAGHRARGASSGPGTDPRERQEHRGDLGACKSVSPDTGTFPAALGQLGGWSELPQRPPAGLQVTGGIWGGDGTECQHRESTTEHWMAFLEGICSS